MKCPSCASTLAAPEPRCPKCKLTLQSLDVKFGALPRHSIYFTDRADRVPVREMRTIRKALELFHQRFPQCLFSVFVADLPRGTRVGEYAFWLANRARFSSAEQVQGENFDLLLLVDMNDYAAALNAGYGLEGYLEEEDLRAGLEAFVGSMRQSDLPTGVQSCLEVVAERLGARWMAMQAEASGATAATAVAEETWA